MIFEAQGVSYRDLNARIRAAVASGERAIRVTGVCGHRYLGVGLGEGVRLDVDGLPGNDLCAFMNGARVVVRGNAQDGVANTMNAGTIVIEGGAGDVLAHSMRGGRLFVGGAVGYRAGIHMKAFGDRSPVVVIGGAAGDYLGEYMAGGTLVVLNLDPSEPQCAGDYIGTGMHGGCIFLRGTVADTQLGREVGPAPLTESDWRLLSGVLEAYFAELPARRVPLRPDEFLCLRPRSRRPYGHLYAY